MKRLNVWNDWNGPLFMMNGAKRWNDLNRLNGLQYDVSSGPFKQWPPHSMV
jgi:hypothetical protein